MKRVLIIDKCQDCNIENCKLRTLCGTIPDECPLDILLEKRESPSWDNAPEWANWLTYDKDGWFWWETKPNEFGGAYVNSDWTSESELYIDQPLCSDTMAIHSRPESHKKVTK